MKSLFAALFTLSALAATATSTNALARTFMLPILTVTGAENDEDGLFQRVPCHWRRTPGRTALRVALADDEPGGTGASFATAAWNAVVTAGLLRGDRLEGVRVTFDIQGGFDGPSAGGAMGLACLAALDGRALPADFGMTGTVSPDGSVGAVGGIAQKVKAAAAAGLRRFAIPQGIRYEDRDGTGQAPPDYVDLRALARELGVTIRPVATLEEAYAFAFGETPAPQPVREIADVTALLPSNYVAVCRRFFLAEETVRRAARKGRAQASKPLLDEDEKDLTAEELFAAWADDALAAEAYEEGYVQAAAREALFGCEARAMTGTVARLRADWSRTCPAFARKRAWRADDRAQALAALRAQAAREAPDLAFGGDTGYVPGTNTPLVAAQLEGAARNAAACAAHLVRYGRHVPDEKALDDLVASATAPDDGEALEKALRQAWEDVLLVQALVAFHRDRAERGRAAHLPWAAALPPRALRGDPAAVSHFLYSAWKAVWRDFETDAVAERGRESGRSAEAVLEALSSEDESFVFVQAFLARATDDQALVDGTLPRHRARAPRYHAVASAVVQAEALGFACAIRTKYAAEDAAHLARAVRRARREALAALARAQRLDLPCPAAVAAFVRAERAFGADGVDLACDVLGQYLAARYIVQALVWLFA